MAKLKISVVLDYERALRDLLTETVDGKVVEKDIPAKAAYRLGRDLKKINSEVDHFNKVRNDLIIKYGKENKNKQFEIKPNSEEYKKFVEELTPVLDEEVEVELMEVTLDMLGDLKVKSSLMAILSEHIIKE